MKKIALLLFISLSLGRNVYANDKVLVDEKSAPKNTQIVSQPSNCHINLTLPCTFKAISRHRAKIGKTDFLFLKNAVVKVIDFTNLNVEPLAGGFIIVSSKEPLRVKGISLTKFPSFADINTKAQVEIVDGKDFYIYRFTEDEPERYLLDREPFIKKMASFYINVENLRAEFKYISPIYNKSFKQDVALHSKMLNRKIASHEDDKNFEEDRARQNREQQRKNKKKFFQRTFVQ